MKGRRCCGPARTDSTAGTRGRSNYTPSAIIYADDFGSVSGVLVGGVYGLLSIGLTYVLVNLLTDVVYRWVNPRMR